MTGEQLKALEGRLWKAASAVRKVIENYLFEKLPSPSFDDDISIRAEILYNDFKERFASYGQRVA